MNRKSLKNKAKDILRTEYWKVLVPIVVVSILSFNFISFGTEFNYYTEIEEYYIQILIFKIQVQPTLLLAWLLIVAAIASIIYSIFFVSVFDYGLKNKLKHIALGDQEQYDIFEGFRHNYKKVVWVQFMAGLKIGLYTLLFIVPGIIKAIEYSFVSEILEEHPDWHYSEVLEESRRLTVGYRWELFVLDISFFLWRLLFSVLDMISFGLASFFLEPYPQMTNVYAYFWLKGDKEEMIEPELLHNNNTFDLG